MTSWSVYVVRTAEGELYTGITTDVPRRFAQHGAGRGAKYLRGRGPLTLAYRRVVGEHGLALRVERRMKGLARAEKEAVVRRRPTRARLLVLLGLDDEALRA
ncbi:MAG: GIY-YIG nuclease family protein [Planctomycetes bacterium]|nr:GIY-YIG nuclease family protein [Planctomycetota bacterium]